MAGRPSTGSRKGGRRRKKHRVRMSNKGGGEEEEEEEEIYDMHSVQSNDDSIELIETSEVCSQKLTIELR